MELIDGTFYQMFVPTTIHQAVGGFIYKILLDHILENKGPCMPFVAPVDVQLDEDDKTMVQPDVLIVCDLEHSEFPVIYGENDTVPVGIWNGKCQVDFSRLFSFIAFLYDE